MTGLIPDELRCDKDHCEHIGVTTTDSGDRLCRAHQVRRTTDALSDFGDALRLFKARAECRAFYNVENGDPKDGVVERVAVKHGVGEADLRAKLNTESMAKNDTDDEQTDESEEWTTMTFSGTVPADSYPEWVEDVDVDAAELVAELEDADDKAPLADGATVHIHAPDPLRVTRAGTTYRAQDIDDEGGPVGDPWALSEGAVRGLLGRHDWTRVEATASVRGGDDA